MDFLDIMRKVSLHSYIDHLELSKISSDSSPLNVCKNNKIHFSFAVLDVDSRRENSCSLLFFMEGLTRLKTRRSQISPNKSWKKNDYLENSLFQPTSINDCNRNIKSLVGFRSFRSSAFRIIYAFPCLSLFGLFNWILIIYFFFNEHEHCAHSHIFTRV